jgi:hypothetical protein
MADAKISANLVGYPTRVGNKILQAFDWTGPTLYATGGMELNASDMGIGGIDFIIGGASRSGTYFALGRVEGEGANQTVKIMVFVASSGAEAGAIDLDAEIFRLAAMTV